MARWLLIAVVVAAAAPSGARAQNRPAAQSLFDEGKRLVEKGDFAAACPKFQASLEIEIKLGTRLALAACYENVGRTASAWAAFRSAAAMASRMGTAEAAREKYALDHAAALEGKLVRLTIAVPRPVPGLVVKLDNEAVPDSTLGVPVPVDPGDHRVTALADDFEPWSTKLQIVSQPSTTVTVPELHRLEGPPQLPPPPLAPPRPAPEPAPAAPLPAEGGTPTLRWVGYGVGAAGVVLVGVGLVFGASANSKWSDAKGMCKGSNEPLQCTPAGVALHDDAVSAANVATITVIGGAAAIAGGVVLILVAHPERRSLALQPTVGPTGAGLALSGAF